MRPLGAVPSVLPSPEFLTNPLSLDFKGFERNSKGEVHWVGEFKFARNHVGSE
jgi:hypothetical protein